MSPRELGGVLLRLTDRDLQFLLYAISEADAGAHERQRLRAIHLSPALFRHRQELEGHHQVAARFASSRRPRLSLGPGHPGTHLRSAHRLRSSAGFVPRGRVDGETLGADRLCQYGEISSLSRLPKTRERHARSDGPRSLPIATMPRGGVALVAHPSHISRFGAASRCRREVARLKEGPSLRAELMVRKKGFEPSRPCGH